MTEKQIKQFDLLSQQVIGGSLTIDEAILRLRGGDGLPDLIAIMIFVVFMNWLDGAESFQQILPPHMDPIGWAQGNYNYNQPKTGNSSKSPTSLQVSRPSAMPHPDFVALTPAQQCALPHSNNMKIQHEGYQELNVGFWQSKFKVGDHGAVHGLDYTVKMKLCVLNLN